MPWDPIERRHIVDGEGYGVPFYCWSVKVIGTTVRACCSPYGHLALARVYCIDGLVAWEVYRIADGKLNWTAGGTISTMKRAVEECEWYLRRLKD